MIPNVNVVSWGNLSSIITHVYIPIPLTMHLPKHSTKISIFGHDRNLEIQLQSKLVNVRPVDVVLVTSVVVAVHLDIQRLGKCKLPKSLVEEIKYTQHFLKLDPPEPDGLDAVEHQTAPRQARRGRKLDGAQTSKPMQKNAQILTQNLLGRVKRVRILQLERLHIDRIALAYHDELIGSVKVDRDRLERREVSSMETIKSRG